MNSSYYKEKIISHYRPTKGGKKPWGFELASTKSLGSKHKELGHQNYRWPLLSGIGCLILQGDL